MKYQQISKQEIIVDQLQQVMLKQLKYIEEQGFDLTVNCESVKELATAINMAVQALEIMQRSKT